MKKIFLQITTTLIGIVLLSAILSQTSCKKDDSLFSDADLKFSSDTLMFDTVFTSVGSTTRIFKIYNTYDKTVRINNISLAGGNASFFRMNIDGIPSLSQNNIEIPANDSLFVFVKVTIDPTSVNSPFVVSDSIIFETDKGIQKVQLIAWGQNAYYHVPDHFSANFPAYSIIACNSTWVNDKPHVIYGYAVVDSECTLTILEGTRVHFHNNGVLWIYKDGTLNVNGTHADPVTFQGDRLEQSYKDIPGQWGKIWLSAGSKNNVIDWAIIKNAFIGLQVDTLGNSSSSTLTISNTIIKNMSGAGILAQGSKIDATNCLITNCSQYAVALTIGGNYNFRHCTIGNYWSYTTRKTPSLLLNNYYKDIYENYHVRPLTNAYFGNCIIYGTNSENEELGRDSFPVAGAFSYKFQNCLIKTTVNTSNVNYFLNCIINQDPSFTDYSNNDYQLSSNSPGINTGNSAISNMWTPILMDLNNNPRTVGNADIGAYEMQ
ncbi:MAG: right-handed parallel beta-helix repeat-containing protein [Bacteroidetes bacterium]|nr:right-handed parallel beta-helix repeat-containing protein [Bacteroidota bacterium]